MKVAVLCNTNSLALPSIHTLKEKGMLKAVGIPEKNKSHLYPQLTRSGVQEVLLVNSEQWQKQAEAWLQEVQPDAVWVFTFPWKIPASLLSIPPQGFMNFHFGLLPKYRGADPVFWQMKNREATCGVTVHQMTPDVDMGPVIWREEVQSIPGETYGMNCARLGLITSNLVDRLVERMNAPDFAPIPQTTNAAGFSKRPDTSDFTIRWKEQTSEEIEWLVNATNPKYDGAITSLRGMEVRIIEVTPVDMNEAPAAEPGTIVHADNTYGLIVACADKKFIRITIMHLSEGYFSGVKLYNIGIRPGEKFL